MCQKLAHIRKASEINVDDLTLTRCAADDSDLAWLETQRAGKQTLDRRVGLTFDWPGPHVRVQVAIGAALEAVAARTRVGDD